MNKQRPLHVLVSNIPWDFTKENVIAWCTQRGPVPETITIRGSAALLEFGNGVICADIRRWHGRPLPTRHVYLDDGYAKHDDRIVMSAYYTH